MHKYGLTLDVFDLMLENQDNRCAICRTDNPVGDGNTTTRKSFSFAVDHCHDTGRVRGLLCNPCNRGLGFFKDDLTLLAKAVQYLEGNLNREKTRAPAESGAGQAQNR